MSGPVRHCGVCGAPARASFRAPHPEIAPELDMRPGEPARSTLPDWVQTCSRCTAAAPDLSVLPPAARAIVEDPAYRALTTTVSAETLPFRRWALICRGTGDTANAAEALLQGAWAADDAAAMTDAATLRQEVATLWGETTDTGTALRRLDALRRAGQFESASTWAATLAARGLDETARTIIAFQQARTALRDTGPHLISSALPPPAHAPHVSHGKRPSPGFWTRLFRKS
ncbi:MAG TPA: hypothetical protein VN702_20635 [Acetobacteraceae bacterium]|nr:hypothetical protein [Acetobacteraceae bacterium]